MTSASAVFLGANPPMRVLLLHNAVSPDASAADRDVLVQAATVGAALAELGHETLLVPCTLDLASAAERMRQLDPDAVFNLVESLDGSDWLAGLVPALLTRLGRPYTGCSTEATIFSAHKLLAKQRLAEAGLPTPAWFSVGQALRSADPPDAWILKSVTEHASFGLDEDCVLRGLTPDAVMRRLEEHTVRLGGQCFAEAYVAGREFNLSLLAGPNGPQVLTPAEIDFSAFPAGKPRVVGQRAKWAEGSFEFENTPRRFDFPAEDRPLLDELARLAAAAWRLFDLAGYARVDFRVDASGRPWILEVNSNPCLSPDAGFYAALTQTGIPMAEAVRRILDEALRRTTCCRPGPRDARRAARREAAPPTIAYRDTVVPGDRQAVRRIVESTGFFSPAEVDVAVELVDERLAKGAASGYEFLFAEQDGRVLGYTCYGPIAATAASFDLYWIAIDKHCQNHGLGRRLMEQSEQRIAAAGGRAVYAETSNRPQYTPTRAFYERFGYTRAALLPDFYAPGDDKVVYVKRPHSEPPLP